MRDELNAYAEYGPKGKCFIYPVDHSGTKPFALEELEPNVENTDDYYIPNCGEGPCK